MQSPRANVSFSTVPKLDAAFVDLASGDISPPWYRFLINLYVKLGGSQSSLAAAVYIQDTPGGLAAYLASTGAFLGYIGVVGGPGGPAQTILPLNSPFIFTPAQGGLLTVFGGRVDLSRNGSAFETISLVGGAIRLLAEDSARIVWAGSPPAPVIFYPDN